MDGLAHSYPGYTWILQNVKYDWMGDIVGGKRNEDKYAWNQDDGPSRPSTDNTLYFFGSRCS
jgi:hypothetical protein